MEAFATQNKLSTKENAFFGDKSAKAFFKKNGLAQENPLLKIFQLLQNLQKKENTKKDSGDFFYSFDFLAFFLQNNKFFNEKIQNLAKDSLSQEHRANSLSQKNFDKRAAKNLSKEKKFAEFVALSEKMAKEEPFASAVLQSLAKELNKKAQEETTKRIFQEKVKENLFNNPPQPLNQNMDLKKVMVGLPNQFEKFDKKEDFSFAKWISQSVLAQEKSIEAKETKSLSLENQVKEILKKAFFEERANGTFHLEAKLHPKEYGTIRLTLNWQDGQVHVRMGVLNEMVRQEVLTVLENLKYDLKHQGIELASLQVFVSSQNHFQQRQDRSEELGSVSYISEAVISLPTEIMENKEEGIYA